MNPFFLHTSSIFDHFEAAFKAHDQMIERFYSRPDKQSINRTSNNLSYKRYYEYRPAPDVVTDKYRASSTDIYTGKRKNTLAREGINALAPFTPGSPNSRVLTTPGWAQYSSPGTGSIKKCGLHNILESSYNSNFVALYEPRSKELRRTLFSESPNFTIQFEVKYESSRIFYIILGHRSSSSFFLLMIDFAESKMSLSHANDYDRLVKKKEIASTELFVTPSSNKFFSIRLEIQQTHIKVYFDNLEVFAAENDQVMDSGTDSNSFARISGHVGFLLPKNVKMIFKNWNVSSAQSCPPEEKSNNPTKQRSSSLINLGANSSDSGKTPNKLDPTSKIIAGVQGSNSSKESKTEGPNRSQIKQNCTLELSGKYDPNLLNVILGEIIDFDLSITFDDIAALSTPKRILKEAVVLPMMMPELFVGIREPWKGVLLFGPPGTGKTMLAKATASANQSTFFNCSSSSLVSKWRGESEKMIKCLFDAARSCAPSIIFFDEVDSLVSARGVESEHEASRRMKSELFSQMDGITSFNSKDKLNPKRIMVLSTTNCPWDLDSAILRRFEKRILVALPEFEARKEQFDRILFSLRVEENVNTSDLARRSEGYSCADIQVLCREASMNPMRRMLESKTMEELKVLRSNGDLNVPMVLSSDFEEAFHKVRPSVDISAASRYLDWNNTYGSS